MDYESQIRTKKRHRITLVCTNCKKRKSKCDRTKPCGTCIRLGDTESCVYLTESLGNLESSTALDGVEQVRNQTSFAEGSNLGLIKKKRLSLSRQDNDYWQRIREETLTPGYYVPMNEETPLFIDLIPNGFYLETKRSAGNLFALFTDRAIENRDPYLKAMVTFRSIAIKKMMQKLGKNGNNVKNGRLPRSFEALSTFDADDELHNRSDIVDQDNNFRTHQTIHKSLFNKFAQYRENNATKFNEDSENISAKDYLPSLKVLEDEILTYFERKIYNMIPIFDMNILRHEITVFYQNVVDKGNPISVKHYDHMIFCIILLIIKICQLSVKFCKLTPYIYPVLFDIDTSKFLALVNHYLFEMKILRKCNLLQLQCLILLRFLHWCAPEDGDGPETQYCQILMGTIISSCKEMGINWYCFSQPEKYFFKINRQTRPSYSVMKTNDYVSIFRKIWSYVLFWDRKMCFISGEECQVGKSLQCHFEEEANITTWYIRMLPLDTVMKKINDTLNDDPGKVDLNSIRRSLNDLKRKFHILKSIPNDEKEATGHLNFELEWIIDLFSFNLLHGEMISHEYDCNVVEFYRSFQDLWDMTVHLSEKCYNYFFDSESLEVDSLAKFYTNRIVEIVANKILVMIPAFILRADRFKAIQHNDKKKMIEFLYGISSVYFNEFGFEYYRCFKKMFTAKISYKILNRSCEKDVWRIILQFLLNELVLEERSDNSKDSGDMRLKDVCPVMSQFQKMVRKYNGYGSDILSIWNNEFHPIGRYDDNMTTFKFHLRAKNMESFLKMEKYSDKFNIFSSFYDHASSQLAKHIEANTNSNTTNGPHTKTLHEETLSGPVMTAIPVNDLVISEFDMIQDIFDPLDFVSFF
ncbi:Oleate activated transcription factor 3 [Saccharomyces pastorianus]|uniref:Oleate activated transcription factor 3 n=1 Tax=Saccharomyces pastorianus TaxID=27292 RepID=A0A6C1ED01_SACPS|nr:Oleate activated transcription factor 3 [Saccharomyces pastorianus]